MEFITSIIGWPLGLIMAFLYKFINSYGLSLIIFTIIIKLVLLPLSVKQQKATAKMTAFKPRMDEIQKKYANNQELMNEELMKLYKEEGYSPTAGCLPMLIQLPILFGLIDVIYKPLKHVLRVPDALIQSGLEILKGTGVQVSSYAPQISLISEIHKNPSAFETLPDLVSKVESFSLDFCGINLGQTPTFGFNLLILIPILAGITSFLVSFASMKNASAMAGENNPMQATSKVMMFMMPLMSLWIAFSVPAGVGMYWIISNILMLGQTILLNKIYNPVEMAEKARQQMEERRKELAQERKAAKQMAKEKNAAAAEKALSQKEINRQKLAAARKRDAIKYGEEFVDVTNEDLK